MHYYKISLTALTTFILTISSTAANFSVIFPPSQVLAQTANNQQAEASRLEKQGFQEFNNKQIPKARQFWQQALTLYREIKERKKESFLLILIGMTYQVENQHQTAINYLEQALPIAQQLPNRHNEMSIFQLLVMSYSSLKNYDKALEFAQQALVSAKTNNNYESEKTWLINIAEIYEDNLQDYGKAIEYYQQALVRAKAENDQKTERNVLVSLSQLYQKMPNPR
ncbi:tetratricopeptide repeat protein [Tolypothrix sp. FACHB-123]|uniref:tetratricopeptide repeat protein n=1 Tax=Tolypothrix sp. FACHB-123 TaxID=2692868 RepID=UPI00168846C0|nr:tetratricopeptide repeat protein [Tolypothrix sp. FACHB-123]MBD2355139.1 tetratricopeptide repeat protein [Tolypothrix sp. FACHB-123]